MNYVTSKLNTNNIIKHTLTTIKLILAALLLTCSPYIAHANTKPKTENHLPTVTEYPEDNLLVLKILLGRIILTDGLIGYQYKESILLPLGEFAQLLEFCIDTDTEKGAASGWYVHESRTFNLDLHKKRLTIARKDHALKPGQVELGADDILATLQALEEWFPLSLEYIPNTLTIHVTSREPLPIEERLEREEKRGRLGKNNNLDGSIYRRVKSPYKPARIPFMKVNYNLSYSSNNKDYKHVATSLITGDLLYLNSNLFISANNDGGLSNARLSMGRKDFESGLLGPFKATEFSLGDVYMPQIPLVSTGQAGRGMNLSNLPLGHISEFDTVPIRGDTEPDWEVELYRNDVLLAFQRAGADGIYEFLDVPLLPGLNIIKLLFYGPFNQKREKIHRFLKHADLLKKGRFYYRFSGNEHNEDLIAVGDDKNKTGAKQGKKRYFIEGEYGLAKKTTITSNFITIPLEDGRQNKYCGLGLRTSFGGIYGRLDVAKHLDEDKGTAARISFQTRFGGYGITAKHDQFSHNFVSEKKKKSTNPLTDSTLLRVNGSLPMPALPPLSLGLTGKIDHFASGKINTDISNSISLSVTHVHISHKLQYKLKKGGIFNRSSDMLDGKLLLSLRIKKLTLRADIGYGLNPDEELRTGTLTSDYKLNKSFGLQARINHQFQKDNSTGYSFGLNKKMEFKGFICGLNTTYADDGSYSAGISVSMSIGHEPRKKTGIVSSQSMADKGLVSARAFLDENLSGQFDEGDIPLQDVRFCINRVKAKTQTDDQGTALLTNISPYTPMTITIDSAGFEDPYLIAKEDTVEVITRPGVPILLDFPVSETGEVEGTVFLKKDDEMVEASNVEIELIDREGKVVKKTKTAFDGFYLLDMVPLGSYMVRVSEAQLKRLKFQSISPQNITLTKENLIISIEFTLEHLEDKEEDIDNSIGEERRRIIGGRRRLRISQ